MGIRKTQLKREQRKQRRMSLQEGTPLPPPLPRQVSKRFTTVARRSDGSGSPTSERSPLRRRFSIGARAQSELNMGGKPSWNPERPTDAAPRRSSFMLLARAGSFRRFSGGGSGFLRTLQRAPSIIENGPAAWVVPAGARTTHLLW